LMRKLGLSLTVILSLFVFASATPALAASALLSRGYTVLPAPQSITFTGKDFSLTSGWRLELAGGVKVDDVAVTTLKEDLAARFGLALAEGAAGGDAHGVIRLAAVPGSVTIGAATDRDRPALAEQAYFLELRPQSISIRANAAAG